jgi:proteasome lid subunit RPN8/RPN11
MQLHEMNRLWEASVREIDSGIVREHAALLVWEREGLRLTNIVEGKDDEVLPNYQLEEGQQFVGTFHTHPYVTGWLGIPFSEADIASTLVHKENISIIHSIAQPSPLNVCAAPRLRKPKRKWSRISRNISASWRRKASPCQKTTCASSS